MALKSSFQVLTRCSSSVTSFEDRSSSNSFWPQKNTSSPSWKKITSSLTSILNLFGFKEALAQKTSKNKLTEIDPSLGCFVHCQACRLATTQFLIVFKTIASRISFSGPFGKRPTTSSHFYFPHFEFLRV